MKIVKSIPSHEIKDAIIGRATRANKIFNRKNKILVKENIPRPTLGYSATLSCSNENKQATCTLSHNDIEKINEGDVLSIMPDGSIQVLWDINSKHNCFLLTEACNCRCLMCPQPPKNDNPDLHILNKKIISLLDYESVKSVCFTGGEPTLYPKRFVELMDLCKKKLPSAHYSILTNALPLSNFEVAKKIAMSAPINSTFCISLHADVSELNDKITGVDGSFIKTIKGIHNLAKLRQKIEIRPVINRLNYKRIRSFAAFLYRNFPFAIHIAFMGMEITGNAISNYKKIWIDPYHYSNDLYQAAWDLHRKGMNVSIYNIPLCLIPKESWMFSRQSISDWKNDYLPVCSNCSIKTECCGVFTTSKKNQSKWIKPVDK